MDDLKNLNNSEQTEQYNQNQTMISDLEFSSIQKFIYEFEKEKEIQIFFVGETNSRPNGVDVENSDFDLKGFYLPDPSDSLRIIPKIPTMYKIDHLKVTINNIEYDVDIDIKDFREFGIEKVRDNIVHFDYLLYSPTVYINKYPNIIEKIKEKLIPSPDDFRYRFNSLHQLCEKSITKSGECLNKKLLAALICGVQYLHVYIYNNFPFYNIWSEIDFLKTKMANLISEKIITLNELNLLERVFDLIRYYFEEKKTQGRKSNSQNISEYQFQFLKLINDKYTKNLNKKTWNNFTLEFFEELCGEVLYEWKKIKHYK